MEVSVERRTFYSQLVTLVLIVVEIWIVTFRREGLEVNVSYEETDFILFPLNRIFIEISYINIVLDKKQGEDRRTNNDIG